MAIMLSHHQPRSGGHDFVAGGASPRVSSQMKGASHLAATKECEQPSQQSFRAGKHPPQLSVLRTRHAQGSCKGLEQCLNLVMIRAPVERLRVHVGFRAARESVKEI